MWETIKLGLMPLRWTELPRAEPGLLLGQRGAASIVVTGLPVTAAPVWLQLCWLVGQILATVAVYRPGRQPAPPAP